MTEAPLVGMGKTHGLAAPSIRIWEKSLLAHYQ
jgi:hypothetical protein